MKHSIIVGALLSLVTGLYAQNPLVIPPLLSGSEFNLHVQTGVRTLVPGFETPTYGVNGDFLAPTLLMRKGDSVTLHVRNSIGVTTTMHWHGLHLPAVCDGGPHQLIKNGSTWSPSFRILNDAGTYWYHPHGEGKTELQVSKGLAGMIIVHDSAEEALSLPRRYAVDDFPIIIQTKAFDELHQIAIASEMDTLVLVNGTPHAIVDLPAQVLRLRLLNGSSMRSYMLGFSDSRSFVQIACDDGLLSEPLTLTRLRLSPGERAEILLVLNNDRDRTISLMNFGSELTNGIYGAATVGMGMAQIPDYDKNPLNGTTTPLLQIHVVAQTSMAVTSTPTTLVPFTPLKESQAKATRALEFSPEQMGMKYMVEGPFLINGNRFSMDVINIVTKKNDIEIWSLKNSTLIAHPFHIHNQYFTILDRDGLAPAAFEAGKKDVVLVMPQQTVRFITKYEDFTDPTVPYMYHCHMLHHEDDGMMGSFTVTEAPAEVVTQGDEWCLYPQPADDLLTFRCRDNSSTIRIDLVDVLGCTVYSTSADSLSESLSVNVQAFASGQYTLVTHSARGIERRSILVSH